MYKALEDFLPEASCKKIAEKRSIGYDLLERAFDIVKNFIIKKKRIIYGGMSIDMALKAAGKTGIYEDDAVPDYDFMSPDPFKDSIELTDILYKEFGDNNVNSINALHPTTRRVRINYVFVADITYIPPGTYEKLPTLEYKGFRVIHPNFQRLDMHRAMCNPLENPPREIVFFRTHKDLKRFGLLDDAYPIPAPKLDMSKSVELTLSLKYFQDSLIGGGLGLCLIIDYLERNGCKSMVNVKILEQDTDTIRISVPESLQGIFATLNPHTSEAVRIRDMIIADQPKVVVKNFCKFQDDIKPQSILVLDKTIQVDIYDTKGRLVPYITINSASGIELKLVAPHGLMMMFLERSFATDDSKSWLMLYVALLDLFKQAQAKKLLGMSSDVYGFYNWSAPFLVNAHKLYAQIEGYEIPVVRPPNHYETAKAEKHPTFDYSTSWAFAIDGAEVPEFKEPTMRLEPKK